MRFKVRARNRRGVIRTDFGARKQTAPLEGFIEASWREMVTKALLDGSAFATREPPFHGPSLGEMLLRDDSKRATETAPSPSWWNPSRP